MMSGPRAAGRGRAGPGRGGASMDLAQYLILHLSLSHVLMAAHKTDIFIRHRRHRSSAVYSGLALLLGMR